MKAKIFIPKYQRILDELTREIALKFKKNDIYYSQRELMQRYNASYATVGRVLSELKAKGILESYPRKKVKVNKLPVPDEVKPLRFCVYMNYAGGEYYKGLIEAQAKYNFEIRNLMPQNDNPKKMLADFMAADGDGIIFFGDNQWRLIELVQEKGIKYVVVRPTRGKYEFCADIDDGCGIRAAVRELIKEKRRNILYITGYNPEEVGYDNMRYEIFQRVLKENGIIHCQELYKKVNYADVAVGVDEINKIISTRKDYDAIFLLEPRIYKPLQSIILKNKIKVPEELRIISYGWMDATDSPLFPVGIIYVPHSEAVIAGAEILIEQCNSEDEDQKIRLLRSSFTWS